MLPNTPHRFFEGGCLPEKYNSGRHFVVFNTDFRRWLKYEYISADTDLIDSEKWLLLNQICITKKNEDAPVEFVIDALRWFYSCADIERMANITITDVMTEAMGKRAKKFSMYWDFYKLWASFKQQYNIDLYSCGNMHWWEFMRLMDELKPDSHVAGIRHLRGLVKADICQPDEKGQKAQQNKNWSAILCDKYFAALPGVAVE